MPSINEVAKIAGVSTATVSRTFRTPDLLSHKTRRHVLEVAERLNYQPRQRLGAVDADLRVPAGRGAGTKSSELLGLLFFATDLEGGASANDFYAPVIMGAQAEAGRCGLHMILRTASRYKAPTEMPKMFRRETVAGMLLVGAALPEVLEAYEAHLPISVIVDNRDLSGRHDCVLSDGFGGMLDATRHLIAMGHRRIAFLQDEPTAPSFVDRKRGYLCALWEAGIEVAPEWIINTNRHDELEPCLQPLLSGSQAPTAIVAANDTNAFSVLAACRTLGVDVPKDLSVLGFDDTTFGIHSYPPLTTVRVNKEHIGRLAVRQLLTRLEESQTGEGRLPSANYVVPTSLVSRDSCAPPKS